jgi:hypothetical protein
LAHPLLQSATCRCQRAAHGEPHGLGYTQLEVIDGPDPIGFVTFTQFMPGGHANVSQFPSTQLPLLHVALTSPMAMRKHWLPPLVQFGLQ